MHDITVLGGGIAGLATGYYAKKYGVPFEIYEAAPCLGGNCVTFRHGDFRFDSGAHRLHDKDSTVTRDIQGLLGADLRKIAVPSQIFDNGRLIQFPFVLHSIVRHLGVLPTMRAALDFMAAHLSKRTADSFASHSIRRYGRTVAERFLLSYTEKLWGTSCDHLSPVLTGGRLRGLDVWQLVSDTIWKPGVRRDMEGDFLYPSRGIGMVSAALSECLGEECVRTNAQVTKILHDEHQIRSIEINNEQFVPINIVVNTLPVDELTAMFDPTPPKPIIDHSQQLTYRNIILVALFLRKPSVTAAATVYFPDHRFPFTRVVEPRNRSSHMSPPGHTSLVAELPCDPGDGLWLSDNEDLVDRVSAHLKDIGWLTPEEVVGTAVRRLHHAYPVITVDSDQPLAAIKNYLARFPNLALHGRNGTFQYKWIHNLFREAQLVVRRSHAVTRTDELRH